MPINQEEPAFTKLTKRDKELLRINQPPVGQSQLDQVRDQAKAADRGKRKQAPNKAEWE